MNWKNRPFAKRYHLRKNRRTKFFRRRAFAMAVRVRLATCVAPLLCLFRANPSATAIAVVVFYSTLIVWLCDCQIATIRDVDSNLVESIEKQRKNLRKIESSIRTLEQTSASFGKSVNHQLERRNSLSERAMELRRMTNESVSSLTTMVTQIHDAAVGLEATIASTNQASREIRIAIDDQRKDIARLMAAISKAQSRIDDISNRTVRERIIHVEQPSHGSGVIVSPSRRSLPPVPFAPSGIWRQR